MSGRGEGTFLAAGGPIRHIPVLREEALAALAPRAGGVYLDATFGAGGYTSALLAIAGTHVIAFDRDPAAIAAGEAMAAASDGRLRLRRARFGDIEAELDALGAPAIDGAVLDVGVSSMQVDDAGRGFSFRLDGPLDMRMGGDGPTAADLVNGTPADELADLIFRFGEERASRRIARAIALDRAHTPFTRTRQLADMIARVVPAAPNAIHPATRTFQALRIAVNDELGELSAALAGAEARLAPGGCLAVVTFHSLEDRIAKRFFQSRSGKGAAPSRHVPGEPSAPVPSFALPRKQPLVPGSEEVAANPRARSAKLRFGYRTDAPAWQDAIRAGAVPPTRYGR